MLIVCAAKPNLVAHVATGKPSARGVGLIRSSEYEELM
jgi:hypothetical protein